MKYIFRCALLKGFTDNRENVTISDLKDSLSQAGYKCPSVEKQISLWTTCIEELINQTPLKPEDVLTIIKKHGEGRISEQEATEIATVWENDNELIFIHRLKNTLPYPTLQRLQWSVNNKMYGKYSQHVGEVSAIVNLNLKDQESHRKTITFELDHSEVQNFGNKLRDIESSIDRLMGIVEQS